MQQTASLSNPVECRFADDQSGHYGEFKSVNANVTRRFGHYCQDHYVEILSADSTTLYIENGQVAYPFSEYAPCVGLASSTGRFSESAPKSAICTEDRFVEIISGWKGANSQTGGGIGAGAIAGITVGSVLIVVVVAIVAFCIGKSRTKSFLPLNELQSTQATSYVENG
jgi:hypothetical protein